MAQPAGEQRVGRQPRGIVRVFRAGHGHQSPLPIYLAYLNGCARLVDNPDGVHGRQPDVDQHGARSAAGRDESAAEHSADRSRWRSRPPGRTPRARGLPANFFVVNPDARRRQRDRQRRLQRLPRAAARAEAPAVEGPAGQRQLPVRDRGRTRRSSASATAAR